MNHLYHVSSSIENLEIDGFAFQGGVIHWYNVSERTGLNYDLLIEGYGAMEAPQKIYCQELAAELLTKEEIDVLKNYLDSIKEDTFQLKANQLGTVRFRKADLPIDDSQMGYRHMPQGGTGMHYPLNERADYNIPMTIVGYFNPTEESFDERIEASTAYVRRALQMLSVDAGVKHHHIEGVVKELFNREGLYITSTSIPSVLDTIEVTE